MLVLASASPRRHELLLAAEIPHVIRPAYIPEDRHPDEPSSVFVRRLAAEKAAAVAASDDEIVLGADTVVCLGNEIFGKPADASEAAKMLGRLSGRSHTVQTGVCLRYRKQIVSDVVTTTVYFAELSSSEIEGYLQTGEYSDKAGAYAIQGFASRFVDRIEGSYHNVVGLPIAWVYRNLAELISVVP